MSGVKEEAGEPEEIIPGLGKEPRDSKDRRRELAELLRGDSTRFTYYMAGVALAVLAWTMTASTPPATSYAMVFQLLAWAVLGGALIACIHRLGALLSMRVAEARYFEGQWYREALQDRAIKNAAQSGISVEQVFNHEWYRAKLEQFHARELVYNKEFKRLDTKTRLMYLLAVYGVLVGLALQATTRVIGWLT